jgi:GNAT superfamily N-acetyltransferase
MLVTTAAWGRRSSNQDLTMELIRLAESDEEISSCFRVVEQLRPHLLQETFVDKIRRQQTQGYRLAFLTEDDRVLAVAGFRVVENLVGGRILYVDDLVTDSASRSFGRGRTLFGWLVEQARVEGCRFLELDSGVQRFDAHRFYLSKRMMISSHHFRLTV